MKRKNQIFNGGGQKYLSFAEILVQFPKFLVTNKRGAFYA